MRAQNAVHDQIGIAADGRGEVRVAGGGQREVARVYIAIARLLERAQHQVAQDALLRLAFDLRDQLLIISRREMRIYRSATSSGPCAIAPLSFTGERFTGWRRAERIAELRRDLFEFDHALGIRAFRGCGRSTGSPAASMCEATASFAASMNSSMRRCAMLRGAARHADHLAEFVELEQRLRQIEIDGPAPDALAVQHQRQLTHHLEARHQRRVTLAQCRIAFEQPCTAVYVMRSALRITPRVNSWATTSP